MVFEDDFVKEEIVDFEIEGRKFSYKPVTGGQENDWLNEYMSIDENGKIIQDFSKLNKCKARNLKKVPYDKETIEKIIGVSKEWEELNDDQRWSLLYKLGSMFDKLFTMINNIDKPDTKKKDNSLKK